MSRRGEIRMTAGEAAAFLDEQRTMICATNGHDGFPHLMPLWYVVRTQPTSSPGTGPQPTSSAGTGTQPTSSAGTGNDSLWAWSYGKAQKVRNLERDPRATLQIESGEAYDQLRGLMLRTEATLHRDAEVLEGFVAELARRYAPEGADPEALRDGFARQIPKRVAIEFTERDRVTWDHRKLGGGY